MAESELSGARVFDDRVEYQLGSITASVNLLGTLSFLCFIGTLVYTGVFLFANEPTWPLPAWPIIVFVLGTVGPLVAAGVVVKKGDSLSVTVFKKAENGPEPAYEVHYENRLFASGTFSPEQLRIDTTLGVTSRFGPTPVRVYRLLFNPKHPAMVEHPRLRGDFVLHEDEIPARCTEQLTLLLKTLGFDPNGIGVLVRERPR